MKKTFLRIAGASALAAGMMFAQGTAPAEQPSTPVHNGRHAVNPQQREQRQQKMFNRLSQRLNLTADQQAQAKEIFGNAMQQTKPLRQELRETRKALFTAAKGGNEAEINQLASKQAQAQTQMTTIFAQAYGKFYATLTPDQKAKADSMGQHFMTRTGHRHSRVQRGQAARG